jgi:4a-hydroxytetrahydrobiopterin dehydratase
MMNDRKRLSIHEIKQDMNTLENWHFNEEKNALEKTFVFKSFSDAFGFMTRVALKAEQLDHHPDWSNTYNKVHVSLSTHDAKGISQLDFLLAKAMDSFNVEG